MIYMYCGENYNEKLNTVCLYSPTRQHTLVPMEGGEKNSQKL